MEEEPEEAEEVPEVPSLRNNFVCSGGSAGGEVNFDYKVGVVSLVEPFTSVSVISICAVDQSVLVCVPDGAWHRLKAKRALPDRALRTPVRVAVRPCSEVDRATAVPEASLYVWLGLLAPELEAATTFDDDEYAEIGFPLSNTGMPTVPYAEALVAVCRDHFEYLTAESGDGPEGEAKVSNRLGKLEEGFDEIREMLRGLVAAKSLPSPLVPPVSKAQPSKQSKPAGVPGLDPQLVQQALASGITPAALGEMSKLFAPPGFPAAQPARGQVGSDKDEYSEEDEEEEAVVGGGHGSADQLSRAVVSLSKIVKDMRIEKKTKKDKSLEALLDHAEGSGSLRDVGGSSRSKAAALRSLQSTLISQPSLIYQAIEKNLQADWEASSSTPGVNISQISARGWIEHRSRIQAYPNSVRMAWVLGGIWDALRGGRHEEARARAALGVAMVDQQACDRGQWLLAAEASLEMPPPYSSFNNHAAPESWELQHSRLLDSRWVELFLGKLRDMADFQEKRAKLAGGRNQGGGESQQPKKDANTPVKGKGKGQKGKKKESEEKTPAPQAIE